MSVMLAMFFSGLGAGISIAMIFSIRKQNKLYEFYDKELYELNRYFSNRLRDLKQDYTNKLYEFRKDN